MSFSIEKTREKLQTLNNTQQSIQSTSQWSLFHTRHANDIVSVWNSFFLSDKSTPESRLVLFYLCNDILQLARKKMDRHGTFFSSFQASLLKVLVSVSASKGDNINKYNRVLDVWKERHVYDNNVINEFKKALNKESQRSDVTKTIKASSSTASISTSVPRTANVPEQLESIVSQYVQLEKLTKSFRSNYSKFHTSSTVVLKSDMVSDIPQLQQLGDEIQGQGQELVKLRTAISSEMRKLAAELDDWQMLDEKKTQNVRVACRQLKIKIADIEAEKQQQMVLEQEDNDEMPMYNNEDDDESEEVSPTYESESDNDKQEQEEEDDMESDRKRQKLDFDEKSEGGQSDSWNSLTSILKQLS